MRVEKEFFLLILKVYKNNILHISLPFIYIFIVFYISKFLIPVIKSSDNESAFFMLYIFSFSLHIYFVLILFCYGISKSLYKINAHSIYSISFFKNTLFQSFRSINICYGMFFLLFFSGRHFFKRLMSYLIVFPMFLSEGLKSNEALRKSFLIMEGWAVDAFSVFVASLSLLYLISYGNALVLENFVNMKCVAVILRSFIAWLWLTLPIAFQVSLYSLIKQKGETEDSWSLNESHT